MILPIVAYGDSMLKAEATELAKPHDGLADLIANMWETMYSRNLVRRGSALASCPTYEKMERMKKNKINVPPSIFMKF